MNKIGRIRKLLSEADFDVVSDALHEIGKLNLKELEGDIRAFLSHSDPELQQAAIMVLGTYWGLPDFRDELFGIFSDVIDDDVRFSALINWVGYFRGMKDVSVFKVLLNIAQDGSEDMFVRAAAVRGIYMVSNAGVDETVMNSLMHAPSYKEFESLIPWPRIDEILKDAGLN
ncbi:HEAT repeat domain-containing protein [Chromobacterium phragmitis]|uniref:HEAT repeat domain-containing protein n=1 Tax=Chromobacterium phragmitis TaxID=2202141 RepID=UPI001F488401|nr:HEAT repeat domain-containing protein [Chromobacterium phragmitis]